MCGWVVVVGQGGGGGEEEEEEVVFEDSIHPAAFSVRPRSLNPVIT